MGRGTSPIGEKFEGESGKQSQDGEFEGERRRIEQPLQSSNGLNVFFPEPRWE